MTRTKDGGLRASTLLFGAALLLHGHQGGEVSLVVRQHQGRAMAAGGRHLQRQVDASERDGSEGCGDTAGTREVFK